VPAKRKTKGAYMISTVAEMYEIHPQTLRLYEREGLLKPSRSDGNTRMYTDEDLERLEFILNLARDLGVNISGIAIILQMRERMEEMNRQMQGVCTLRDALACERIHRAICHRAVTTSHRGAACANPPPELNSRKVKSGLDTGCRC
jgi:MerR family transcriptional regulator/heat shock protein HspR